MAITVSLSRDGPSVVHIDGVRIGAILTAALASTLLAGCAGPALGGPGATSAGGTASPGRSTGDRGQARQALASLTVAAQLSMAGYSRDRFKTWTVQSDGCDTREEVLKRDGKNVRAGAGCKITFGTWVSPYDGKVISKESQLDIDHVVPLADAWRSGAKNWTDDKRSQFANDLADPQLLAVSASANRAKGDQDPSTWKPPNHAFWCAYAEDWVAVKQRWQLNVTQNEKAALAEMLGTCR